MRSVVTTFKKLFRRFLCRDQEIVVLNSLQTSTLTCWSDMLVLANISGNMSISRSRRTKPELMVIITKQILITMMIMIMLILKIMKIITTPIITLKRSTDLFLKPELIDH